MDEQFPIGGPRKAVYDALKIRGFKMSSFSDKWWIRRDGLEAGVYGAGSNLAIRRGQETLIDAPMAESLAWLDAQSPPPLTPRKP